MFAQQVIGYGDKGDMLLGISTSGNSENVINAVITAKAAGMNTISLTGKAGGNLKEYCDVTIRVEGSDTAEIQELHLPVYHALCRMLELNFFGR
jgi:D-sedoheptulose 7-phosphate isomerase